MDVHCSSCGEPWDTDHLLHDSIHDTSLDDEAVATWKRLPPAERLGRPFRSAFEAVGWRFGRTLVHVVSCPGCGPACRPDPEVATLKSTIEEILGDDLDAIASEFQDHHL